LSNNSTLPEPRFARYHRLMLVIALIIIAVFLFFPPVTVLDKTHAVGYAICHQIPARTIHINEVPLPLCARCTGIYLGALLAIVGLTVTGRYRNVDLPALPILILLISFIGMLGIDGINSYLSLFPGAPYLYEPQNWLRLTTGTFHGLAMAVIVFPVINGSLWRAGSTVNRPVIGNFKELLPYLAGCVVVILLVLWQQPFLLYPLVILSTGGVLMMLGIVNTMFVLIFTRREGYATHWREIVMPLLMGLAISFLMVGGMDWFRATITRAMGLPF
jgi:uncharacterized membrane protein